MADDVIWHWMGVDQWSRTFEGKQTVVDKPFGGATETLGPSSRNMDTQLVTETFGADDSA